MQFLYLAPVGLVQTDSKGDILLINPLSAQLLMPLSADGSLSNLFTALEKVAPDLRYQVAQFDQPHGMVCDGMRVVIGTDGGGHQSPTVLSLSLLKLDEQRLMVVLNDITQHIKREKLLRQNDAWLNALLIGNTDYVLVSLDAAGRVLACDTSIEHVTGFGNNVAIGQSYAIFSPPGSTTPELLLDRLTEARLNGWSLDEGWKLRADGSQYWGSSMIAPLHDVKDDEDKDDPAFCLVIRDITDKREASEKQHRDVYCDHLTGVGNRRAFFDAGQLELERWRRSPRDLSLIMFDADHFKLINDRWGHAAGDAVLKDLGELLSRSFRRVDVVARLGGEEFGILLPSTPLSGALIAATKLLKAVEAQIVAVDGTNIKYTVSAGVVGMDARIGSVEDLLKRADGAMYAAKANGRNRVECWSEAYADPAPAQAHIVD